jgi:hypothetical protein
VAQKPKDKTLDADMMKNVMAIDVTRLKSERTGKNDTSYKMPELKALAGSLNLPKTGNKKDLVERIKRVISEYNPSAFN